MVLSALMHHLPLGLLIFMVLRMMFSLQWSMLAVAVLIGVIEYNKAPRTDDRVFAQLIDGLTVVGHRACATNAPENTIAGVRTASLLGIKAIEIDVMISADGVPFVFHDSTCDRTTNGTGFIEEMNWADIQILDASCKHPKRADFPNEKIPHLRDLLQECKRYGLKVFLDVKGSRPFEFAAILRKLVADEFPDLPKWAVVCSFYPQTLYATKYYLPQFATILTHRPWVLTDKDTDGTPRNDEWWKRVMAPAADVLLELSIYNFWWYFCGVNAVFVQEEVLSVREIKFWKKHNIDVFVWTVNDPHRKAYFAAMNVRYLTDDCSHQ